LHCTRHFQSLAKLRCETRCLAPRQGLRLETRKRILALESRKGVTRYRMAKDLGLNPGNLHAYLSQGNPTKLSLDRVAALVEYLEAA